MKLVEDAKQAWRWFSVQAMALSMIFIGAWSAIPGDLKVGFPDWFAAAVAMPLLMLGIIGRLVDQAKK